MQDFETYWVHNYQDKPPLSYRLRDLFHKNWIRFHALPESKRYADTQAEQHIISSRAQALADIVLGKESPCWIFSTIPTEDLLQKGSPIEALISQYNLIKGFEFVDKLEDPEDQLEWTVFYQKHEWNYETFKTHLTDIADDFWPKLCWISIETGNLFLPYDGGFDLILSSQKQINDLREKFVDWLSIRPDGF